MLWEFFKSLDTTSLPYSYSCLSSPTLLNKIQRFCPNLKQARILSPRINECHVRDDSILPHSFHLTCPVLNQCYHAGFFFNSFSSLALAVALTFFLDDLTQRIPYLGLGGWKLGFRVSFVILRNELLFLSEGPSLPSIPKCLHFPFLCWTWLCICRGKVGLSLRMKLQLFYTIWDYLPSMRLSF